MDERYFEKEKQYYDEIITHSELTDKHKEEIEDVMTKLDLSNAISDKKREELMDTFQGYLDQIEKYVNGAFKRGEIARIQANADAFKSSAGSRRKKSKKSRRVKRKSRR